MAEATDLKNGNILKNDLIEQLIKYFETDTLLYWDSIGTELRKKQEENWDPALHIFSSKMNLPLLKVTDSLFGLQQDEILTDRLVNFMNELDNFQLAGKKIVS